MGSPVIKIKLRAIDQMTSVLRRVTALVPIFGRKIKNANSDLESFKNSTSEATGSLDKMKSGLKKVGTALSLGITAPVVASGIASIKAFAKFDQGIRGVKTLLDDTSFGAVGLEKGFSKMKRGILDLAKVSPSSLKKLTKGLFDTVSAGIEADKSIEFLTEANRLVVAGLTDVSVAVDGMTSAFGAFGFAADDADKIAAKFFTAQKFGKTTVKELSGSIGRVASIASTAGVSFDELLASVSAATAGSIRTEGAMTGLKAALGNIIRPTTLAKRTAKFLGVAFSTQALKAKGLVKFLDDIVKASIRAGREPSEAFFRLFGSLEAVNVISAITIKQFGKFKSTLAELKDETGLMTTFNKAFEESNRSLSNRMIVLKRRLNVVSVSIGDKLKPIVLRLLESFNKLLDFLEKNPALDELINVLIIVAAVAGPLILVLGFLIGPLLSIAFVAGVLIVGFGILIGSIVALVIGFGILLFTIAGIPLIIAGVIIAGLLLIKNWDTVKIFMLETWDKITEFFDTGVSDALDSLSEFIDNPALIIEKWGFLPDFFENMFANIKDIFETSLNFIKDALKETDFEDIFDTSLNFIKDALKGVEGFLPDFIKTKIDIKPELIKSEAFKMPLVPELPEMPGLKAIQREPRQLATPGLKATQRELPEFGAERRLEKAPIVTRSENRIIVDFRNAPAGTRVRTDIARDTEIDLKLGVQGAAI